MRPTESQESYPRKIAVKGPPRELDDPHAHIANTLPAYQFGGGTQVRSDGVTTCRLDSLL